MLLNRAYLEGAGATVFVTDRILVEPTTLTENIFEDGPTFLVGSRDDSRTSYYDYTTWLNLSTGTILIQLSGENEGTLNGFGSYLFARRKDTGTVLAALARQSFAEVDLVRKSVQDGFLSYDFQHDEGSGFLRGSPTGQKNI